MSYSQISTGTLCGCSIQECEFPDSKVIRKFYLIQISCPKPMHAFVENHGRENPATQKVRLHWSGAKMPRATMPLEIQISTLASLPDKQFCDELLSPIIPCCKKTTTMKPKNEAFFALSQAETLPSITTRSIDFSSGKRPILAHCSRKIPPPPFPLVHFTSTIATICLEMKR